MPLEAVSATREESTDHIGQRGHSIDPQSVIGDLAADSRFVQLPYGVMKTCCKELQCVDGKAIPQK